MRKGKKGRLGSGSGTGKGAIPELYMLAVFGVVGQMSSAPNYATIAAAYVKGLTEGRVDPAAVIAWADDLLCNDPDTQDWMIEISTAKADDRVGVVQQLNTVKGDVDEAVVAELVAQQ